MNLDTGKRLITYRRLNRPPASPIISFGAVSAMTAPLGAPKPLPKKAADMRGAFPLFIMCSVFSDGLCPSLQREQSK